MALIGALTPLVKVAGKTGAWGLSVLEYGVAGVVTSSAVGALLAMFSRELLPPVAPAVTGAAVIAIVGAALLRDTDLVAFPIPELTRQTNARFPSAVAPVLWGVDLGLFFTTHLTMLGIWILPVIAVLGRDLALAAALFAAYWIGRAAPLLLLGPLLLRGANETSHLLGSIAKNRDAIRLVYFAALVYAAVLVAKNS